MGTLCSLCFCFAVEFLKTSSGGDKWSLTDIADHTQLGSPARLATKTRMIQCSSSQGNMDDIVRRLEQQLQESQMENDQLQMKAEKLQRQVVDSNRRAESANTRVHQLEDLWQKLHKT